MPEFVLDAYAARSCPVKTQNAFLPNLPGPVDEGVQERFLGDLRAWETALIDDILNRALAGGQTVLDLRELREAGARWSEREAATTEAMSAGIDVVAAGALPLDHAGHRCGAPKLLVRAGETPDRRPGYVPVEIKFHPVVTARKDASVRVSSFDDLRPNAAVEHPGITLRLNTGTQGRTMAAVEADLVQVAHYWRQLEACERAVSAPPVAGLIGREGRAQQPIGVTWVNLADSFIRTFSRTSETGWKLRSPLDRYDHEHAFRVRVARAALAQTDSPQDPPLLVTPIKVDECHSCAWASVCLPQLDDADLSLRIDKSPLDVREISVLRALGISTIEELAGADLEELLPEYLPEVRHRDGAEGRLRLAARRARLMRDGREFERLSDDPIVVPGAEVEIDLDIETCPHDHVYLWGFLVNDSATGTSEYVSFSSFTELDQTAELALAHEAMAWLHRLVSEREVRVYHYSNYEQVRLRRLAAAAAGDPELDWALAWASEGFVDLFGIMKRHFFGAHGLSLKQVAPHGAGFEWRDEDPSGLNSLGWFNDAVSGDTEEFRNASRQRLLEYNEDDVRATAAVRTWLRQQDQHG